MWQHLSYELTFEIFFLIYLDEDATLSNERMKTAATSATVTVSDICDRTVFPHTSYYILVQDGKYNTYMYIYIYQAWLVFEKYHDPYT